MTLARASALAKEGSTRAVATEIPGGALLEVTEADPADQAAFARLQGLGVIGMMTLDNHHGPHHEWLARGVAVHGH
jgi:hypothetical protein